MSISVTEDADTKQATSAVCGLAIPSLAGLTWGQKRLVLAVVAAPAPLYRFKMRMSLLLEGLQSGHRSYFEEQAILRKGQPPNMLRGA